MQHLMYQDLSAWHHYWLVLLFFIFLLVLNQKRKKKKTGQGKNLQKLLVSTWDSFLLSSFVMSSSVMFTYPCLHGRVHWNMSCRKDWCMMIVKVMEGTQTESLITSDIKVGGSVHNVYAQATLLLVEYNVLC